MRALRQNRKLGQRTGKNGNRITQTACLFCSLYFIRALLALFPFLSKRLNLNLIVHSYTILVDFTVCS